jgi:long-chain acyl-CoA synthetase
VWIYGNSFENFLVAVAVPFQDRLEAWAAANGLGGESFEGLCAMPAVRAMVLGELTSAGELRPLRQCQGGSL